MGAELEGVDQLVASLRSAADRLEDTGDADRAAGDLILARAQPPRRTGYLASTLAATVTTTGVVVSASAPYAAATEARKPWLAPAVTAAESELVTIYADHVADAVATIKGA